MTNEKIIVLVSDRGDSKHGEISVLDDPRKAEQLVETLLEAGFDEDRIRVFTGQASEFEVKHRPVVALANEGEEVSPAAVTEPQTRVSETKAPAAKPPGGETPSADSDTSEEGIAETSEDEEVPAEAAASVKFSSLFRSA